jgi:hypothetical protein
VRDRDSICAVVGADACVVSDPLLVSAVEVLARLDLGRELLTAAARADVELVRGQPLAGVLGSYAPKTRTVTLDDRLDGYSSYVRAAVLAHELRHAADDTARRLRIASADDCYRAEERAFRDQAEVWSAFWQGQLPPEFTSMHAELNGVVRGALRDPVAFAQSVVKAYGGECRDIDD